MIKRLLSLVVLTLACSVGAWAQTTTVTGTVSDTNGNPYVNGTVSAQQIVVSGLNPGPPVNTTTNSLGAFSLSVSSPASYVFTVCATPVNIGPTTNPTPKQVCFSSSPIAISGASQDISTALNAIASQLGPIGATTGVGVTATGNNALTGANTASQINNVIFVDGVKYAQTNAGIQAAVNATPAGGTVYLPTGTYSLIATANEQIKITQAINFICAGWGTNLQLASTAGAIPLLHIVPSGAVRGIKIQDCQFSIASGTPGTYAIEVDASPNNNVSMLVIEHNFISSAFPTGSIYWNAGGEANGGVFDSYVEHNFITGGINFSATGDSNNFRENLTVASGTSDVNNISFTPGSSSFHMKDNTIEQPIHFGAAPIFLDIDHNEIETVNTGITGSNGAFLDVDGTSGNHAALTQIINNSFQIQGDTNISAIRLNFADTTTIGGKGAENNFQIPTGKNGIVTTTSPTNVAIHHNFYNGASWTTILSNGCTSCVINDDDWQPGPSTSLIFQDYLGTTHIKGAVGTGDGIQLVNGANYILVGDGSTNIGLAVTPSGTSATPALGSTVSISTLAGKEIVAPAGAANFDLLWGDSTAHRWKFNNNNAGADTVVGAATTDTLTNKTLLSPIVQASAIGTDTLFIKRIASQTSVLTRWQTEGGGSLGFFDTSGNMTANGNVVGSYVIGNQGSNCTNGEITLSAGWGTTATVTGAKGVGGQVCEWTITSSGTGQAANPTITDTLTNTLPSAVLGTMDMHGGTGTFTMIDHTTLSTTVPVFTFNGTPVAGSTYIVTRRF